MPSVKILFKVTANGEASQREIIQAIKSGTSNRVIPRAIPNRDGNGRLIGVNVNLPVDISNSDLTIATAAINANPGVAVASKFPVEAPNNMDNLVQDQAVSIVGSGTQIVSCEVSDAEQAWEGAAAAESVGGTGSALRLGDEDGAVSATNHITYGEILFDGPTNGIALITACEISGAIKISPTKSGVSCDVGNWSGAKINLMFGGQSFGFAHYNKAAQYVPAPADQWAYVAGFGGQGLAGTGILESDFMYFKYRVNADGVHRFSYSADGVTYTSVDIEGPAGLSDTQMKVTAEMKDQFQAGSVCLQRPIVIDNLKFQVLDGTLI